MHCFLLQKYTCLQCYWLLGMQCYHHQHKDDRNALCMNYTAALAVLQKHPGGDHMVQISSHAEESGPYQWESRAVRIQAAVSSDI